MLIRYKLVKHSYDKIAKRLKQRCGKNVRVPNLLNRSMTSYTIQGLSLVFFAENLGKVMKKIELLNFLKRHGCKTSDPQPRHLGMQFGLDFLIMGSKHPRSKRILRAGEYCLKSLSNAHPCNYSMVHRYHGQMTQVMFNKLRHKYDYRCACCGSMEGEPNYKNKCVLTVLEKGHMDPRKVLSTRNCIPICSVCNKVYKNRYIFNTRGFVKPVK
jgi:hypothetical protein